MTTLTPVQLAVYRLAGRFVRRQTLVWEALSDLRPDLVIFDLDVAAKIRHRNMRQPQMGLWRNEWKYFLHGGGCRLVNVNTNECVEWDAGDIQRFDRYWFVNYLEWLLKSDPHDEDVAVVDAFLEEMRETWKKSRLSFGLTHDLIFSVLEELCRRGVLSRDEQYFTLVI